MAEQLYTPYNPAGGAATAYAWDYFGEPIPPPDPINYWWFDSKSPWQAGEIRQGGYETGIEFDNFNHYGVVRFNFAAIRAQNETHRPTSIRLVFTAAVNQSAKTLRVYLGKSLAGWAQNSRPVPATGTSYKTVTGSGTAGGESTLTVTDPAWLAALVDPDTMCVYINRHTSGYGDGATNPWDTGLYWRGNGPATKMYIDWLPRQPMPTAPIIDAIGTIKTAEKTFGFSDASDPSGNFQPSELSYEGQLSTDAGQSWRPTESAYESAIGVSEITIADLKAAGVLTDAGLLPGQYFKAQCKFRVRTKTPLWGDPAQHYRSNWAESDVFEIDYGITPSAPTFLVTSNDAPYEGEEITLTIGRPTEGQYNTHDSAGAVMQLHYYTELADGTALANGSALVTVDEKQLTYQVGELTTGMTDRVTTIKAKCIDAEGQISPYIENIPFTIKRFRRPRIIVTDINNRTEHTVDVHIRITDTGYGLPQNNGQIYKVSYNHDGAWHDADLGEWNELDNVFTIQGLASGTQYALIIKAINKSPDGTEGKESDLHFDTILSFSALIYISKRPAAVDPAAKYTIVLESLLIHSNKDEPLDKYCLKVLNDIDAGRTIRKGGKPVLTADDLPELPENIVLGTPGLEGNLAAWNEDGDLVDALLPAEKAVAGDTHQLIQHGWGYIRGDGSQEISTTVTFAEEFDDIPDIAVSCSGYTRDYADGPPSHKGDASIEMNEGDKPFGGYFLPTKSNFRVHITRPGANLATNRYYFYSWIAIGPKARTRPSQ